MKAIIAIVECVTNMHVGSGEVNFNVIDRQVERDAITNFPTINASGVKGALREFCVQNNFSAVDEVFGKADSDDSNQGRIKFLSGQLLASPARTTNGTKPYYLVTPQTALDDFNHKQSLILGRSGKLDTENLSEEVEVEGIVLKKALYFQDRQLNIISDENYKMIDLPIIARNKLKNGKSDNLWYEEVVPHESIFYLPFVVTNRQDESLLDEFAKFLEGKVVQFGANASIGYGLCHVIAMLREG